MIGGKMISLALQVFGVKTNTPRDVTLCEFVKNLADKYGDNPFELAIKKGDYSPSTMNYLVKLLTTNGVLIRLKNGQFGGRGNNSASIYVFDSNFYACITDKKALLAKLDEVL